MEEDASFFGEITSSSAFTHSGFSDWKHAVSRVEEHEAGQPHQNATLTWLARTQVHGIDSALKEQCKDEENYWREVLRRVVAVIQFLSERGLAFRGDNEVLGSPHNGNYLGILELLSQFDPFLAKHIKKYGNKGRGTTDGGRCQLTKKNSLMAYKSTVTWRPMEEAELCFRAVPLTY